MSSKFGDFSGLTKVVLPAAQLPDIAPVSKPSKAKKTKPIKTMPDRSSAQALTQQGMLWLRSQYPEALIIREFSIGKYGKARLDIAAITYDEIIGIEVKGRGDSPARLELQAAIYERAASRMYLLVEHDEVQKYSGYKPPNWRILYPQSSGKIVQKSYGSGPPTLHNAPGQLLQTLWQAELVKVAQEFEISGLSKANVDPLIHRLSADIPLGKLRPAICRLLHKRNWPLINGYDPARFMYPGA